MVETDQILSVRLLPHIVELFLMIYPEPFPKQKISRSTTLGSLVKGGRRARECQANDDVHTFHPITYTLHREDKRDKDGAVENNVVPKICLLRPLIGQARKHALDTSNTTATSSQPRSRLRPHHQMTHQSSRVSKAGTRPHNLLSSQTPCLPPDDGPVQLFHSTSWFH
jgi:hypothetical protein